MIARLVDNQWIYLENITPWEETQLDERFSAENPSARFIDNSQYQTWDGVYRRYHKGKKRLARPFLAELRSFTKKKDLQLVVEDDRPKPKYRPVPESELDENFLPGIVMFPFQVEAVRKAVWGTEVGVIDITTGGGKTEIMAAICKAIKCPTAIVAEQRIVIDQIRDRLKLRDVCEEPGMFYAGKTPDGELIIVGTIQSLVCPKKKPKKPEAINYKDTKSSTAEKKFKDATKRHEASVKGWRSRTKKAKLIRSLIGKCEMIIVDECDLATGDTYKKLFRYWFKGRRRYGLSGTPYDEQKPVQRLLLQEHLGSVIYRQNRDQVQKTGLIVPLEYYMVAVGEDGNPKDGRAYDIAYDEEMVYSDYFYKLIAAICDKHKDEGTLILVERDDLGRALNELIPSSAFIHGKTPKGRRPGILRQFEDRELRVLIGGKNVRRGMDLSGGCEALVLATGGKLQSEFDQRLGRARRRNSQGKARVYDFYFVNNKYLYAHSRQRLKAADAMGYKTVVAFHNGIVDGAQLIKSRFRRPSFAK